MRFFSTKSSNLSAPNILVSKEVPKSNPSLLLNQRTAVSSFRALLYTFVLLFHLRKKTESPNAPALYCVDYCLVAITKNRRGGIADVSVDDVGFSQLDVVMTIIPFVSRGAGRYEYRSPRYCVMLVGLLYIHFVPADVFHHRYHLEEEKMFHESCILQYHDLCKSFTSLVC